MPLWLIGMMGSGKSTVGKLLSSRLGVEFVDTDLMVEEQTGRTIPEIWEEEGEESFRLREAAAVAETALRDLAIVATGGGVVLHEPSVEMMRSSGVVVWLDAEPVTLAARIGFGRGRPLLDSANRVERLAELAADRGHDYAAACHHRVVTDDRSLTEVVNEVEVLWNA
ncbi:MAG: shikimate kinase [Acidimicrobiia bacterium]